MDSCIKNHTIYKLKLLNTYIENLLYKLNIEYW